MIFSLLKICFFRYSFQWKMMKPKTTRIKSVKEAVYNKQRQGNRVAWVRPVLVVSEIGDTLLGHTVLLSMGGVGIRLVGDIEKGENVRVFFMIEQHWHEFEAKVAYCRPATNNQYKHLKEVGLAFTESNAVSRLWLLGKSK
jgi:hypothetical protein